MGGKKRTGTSLYHNYYGSALTITLPLSTTTIAMTLSSVTRKSPERASSTRSRAVGDARQERKVQRVAVRESWVVVRLVDLRTTTTGYEYFSVTSLLCKPFVRSLLFGQVTSYESLFGIWQP